ncbi:Serine protease K12H47, partial [Caligus rogercresseyi]
MWRSLALLGLFLGAVSAETQEKPFYVKLSELKQSIHAPIGTDHERTVTRFYNQTLDHFSEDTRTWKQKYDINDEFFKKTGGNAPVFLKIGGEGPASSLSMKSGAWYGYAREV